MFGRLAAGMERSLSGVTLLRSLLAPSTVKRMAEAGMFGPGTPVALGAALPWLLGRGASLGIVSQMNALSIGGKDALVDRAGPVTWRALDRRANRAGRALRRSGLVGGDRVALLLRNSREFAEVLVGAQKAGIVACPLNTWAKPKELAAMLESARARVLVYDAQHAEQVDAAAPADLELVAVGDGDGVLDGAVPYEDFLSTAHDAPMPPFARDVGSARVVIHTSGTSGKPKGAARDDAATALRPFVGLLGVAPFRRDDVVYCPAPLFHSFGFAMFSFAAILGATVVLPESFDPERSLELVEEHRATVAAFVPVMVRRMLALDDDVKARHDLSSLRIVMVSGSAMSPELRRAATRLLGDAVYDLYGSTETGWVTIATPEDIAAHPTSVGRPVPGVELAVFGPEGDRLGPGEPGELFVRSGVLFEGYTSGESKEQHDGFMSIGDVGRIDDEGYVFVEGRADDMVVVGGENVYPIEIEGVVESVAGVQEAAVVGVADEEYGEVLAAFVTGSAKPDAIRSACERDLASYKVPKRIEVVPELPRTATGKVLKRELVAQLSGAEPLDT